MKRLYQITLGNRTHDVELIARSAGSVTFSIAGETHTAQISTPLVLQDRQPLASSSGSSRAREAAPANTTPGSVVAPMPGIVAKMLCQPGEQVTRDAPLLIIEAMKMENTISAPCDGKVARLAIQAGDEVRKGQILVELTIG